MTEERRKNREPAPGELEKRLNELQLAAYHRMEQFGWEIQFIRQPLFQDPVAVVTTGDGEQVGVLELDGTVNLNPDIRIRK